MTRVKRALQILGFVLIHKLCLYGLILVAPLFDTSSELALDDAGGGIWREFAKRLMAWDNVHFNSLAVNNGPIYEHQFAFSSAWATIVRYFAFEKSPMGYSLTAAWLSLVAHYFSALLTDYLGSNVSPVIGELYALHPAGIFLVNGYTESVFAMLVLLGLVMARKRYFILASTMVSLATLFRSNGVLWGVFFVQQLYSELALGNYFSSLRVILGGIQIFLAFVVPQVLAYNDLCPGLAWCNNTVPSVYFYVQEHYWNNGFLRYWTLGNIPNFLMALPTLILLYKSSLFLRRQGEYGIMWVQLVMLVGATLFWHVQIITRLSSCTPGPTWYIADLVKKNKRGEVMFWLSYCVLWTSVQSVLFGAFLPPA